MKNLFLIALLLVGFQIQIDAQNNAENCGYVPDAEYLNRWKNPNSIQNKRLNFLKKYPIQDLSKIRGLEYKNQKFQLVQPFDTNTDFIGIDNDEEDLFGDMRTIPIVAHVVRKTNETGGISKTAIKNAISTANAFYSTINMELEICEFRYIDDDGIFYHTFNTDSDSIGNSDASYNVLDVTSRNVSRKINIYFAANSSTSWTWRPGSNDKKQHIMMKNSHAINGTTLSHEIGHWFDLVHTHYGLDELVDGSNCDTQGDFVCDTPADPNLSGNTDSSCNYTGGSSIVDANGDTYNPDPTNLLSYAGSCRNRFTSGQCYRMQSHYLGMEEDRGYTLNSCNGVGDKIDGYKWTEGWTTSEFYTIGRQPYLFLLKEKGYSGSNKNVHIHKMKNNGKVGDVLVKYKWTQGWTSAKFYTIGDQIYLFLLKEEGYSSADKNVHIHEINSDGSVGDRIAEYRWTEGWTNVEFYTIGGQTYLFLLKEEGYSSSDKNVHIHKINSNGKVGDKIANYRWTEGWTNTEFYTIGGKTFLFLLKEKGFSSASKNVHIHKMNNDGTVGNGLEDFKWTQGWTGTEFYTIDNKTYLFLLKEEGLSNSNKNVHIHEMNNDGKVGVRVADYKWTEGWTNSEFNFVDNDLYLFLLKEKGYSSSNKNVHIHEMK